MRWTGRIAAATRRLNGGRLERDARVAVFTSITGGRDRLKEDQNFEGADFIAFLDEPPTGQTNWNVRPACDLFRDPVRNAKVHRVLAHQYLAGYDYSLWLDGSITLNVPVRELVERYLRNSDLAAFPHFARDCIYDEAKACLEFQLDDPAVIEAQVASYRASGYPEHNGLTENGVLLRRHTAAIERFNNAWWAEICRYSRRDQLSFNHVVHTQCLPLTLLPENLRVSPFVTRHEHSNHIKAD